MEEKFKYGANMIKEIIIWGLCRSGNHALGSFIMEHFPASKKFKNKTPNQRYKLLRKHKIYLNNYGKKKMFRFPVPLPNFGKHQIVSFENAGDTKRKPSKYMNINILKDTNQLNFDIGRKNIEKYIFVILRDPFNWFASYYKYLKEKEYYINLWKQYATNFFLNENKFWFPVNYNKMCKSIDYRKEISAYINEPFIDDGIGEIISIGSTFTKREYNGRALDMKTNERWKTLPKSGLKLLKSDPEIIYLSKKIFNFEI